MSVRMSVGDIFCMGAEAALKNASKGSVISSLNRLRFLRMGTIIAMFDHLSSRAGRRWFRVRRNAALLGMPGILRRVLALYNREC